MSATVESDPHELVVNLVNADGMRLTTYRLTNEPRTTPLEHQMCRDAETMANKNLPNSQFGPWTVVSSKWVR